MKNRKAALLQDKAKLSQLEALRRTREQIVSRELTTHNVVLELKQQQFSDVQAQLAEREAQLANADSEYRKRLQSGAAHVRELQELSRFVSALQAQCVLVRADYKRVDGELHQALKHQSVLVQRLKAAGIRHTQAKDLIKDQQANKNQLADAQRESDNLMASHLKSRSNLFTSNKNQNSTE